MAKAVLLLRALAVALLALFALPSCFTTMVWGSHGSERYTEPCAVQATQTCVLRDEDGALQGFALQLADEVGPLGAEARGKWLLLSGLANKTAIAAILDARAHGQLGVPELAIVIEWVGPRSRATLTATVLLRAHRADGASVDAQGLQFDGDTVRASSSAVARLLDHAPDATTPFDGGAPQWSRAYWADPVIVVAGKVLITPITVVLDIVTLPVQLLGAIAYSLSG
jgi:hypothetical protein